MTLQLPHSPNSVSNSYLGKNSSLNSGVEEQIVTLIGQYLVPHSASQFAKKGRAFLLEQVSHFTGFSVQIT